MDCVVANIFFKGLDKNQIGQSKVDQFDRFFEKINDFFEKCSYSNSNILNIIVGIPCPQLHAWLYQLRFIGDTYIRIPH